MYYTTTLVAVDSATYTTTHGHAVLSAPICTLRCGFYNTLMDAVVTPVMLCEE
jgi:hypothetical protein